MASAIEYWMSRMRDEAERTALQASEEIRRMYARQYRKLIAQIESLYGAIEWGEEHKITRTQLWQYSRWRELEENLREYAEKSPIIEIETMRKSLDRVFQKVIEAPVDVFTSEVSSPQRMGLRNLKRTTETFSSRTVVGTKWSGADFSERVWANTQEIAQRIKNDIEDMVVQGKGLRDVRRELMRDFGVAYEKADRLVRTEASYVFNQAALARMKDAGAPKVKWRTKNPHGTECPVCEGRNGKVWLMDTQPLIPAHPNCFCVYLAVFDDFGKDPVPVDGPEAEQKRIEAEELERLERSNRKKAKKVQ